VYGGVFFYCQYTQAVILCNFSERDCFRVKCFHMRHKKSGTSIEERILFDGREVRYVLKTSLRSRSIRLTALRGEGFVVTRPRGVPKEFVERFLLAQKKWILAKMKFSTLAQPHVPTKHRYKEKRDEALCIIEAYVDFWNSHYKLDVAGVYVRNQKTRWGSCSRRKNLTFNFQVAYLPEGLREYVIVHELCHMLEFNHSKAFWARVAEALPDYAVRRRELRGYAPR